MFSSDPACVCKNKNINRYSTLPDYLKEHYLIGDDYTDGKMAQAIIDSLPRKEYENYDRDMRKEKQVTISEIDPYTKDDHIRFTKKKKRDVPNSF